MRKALEDLVFTGKLSETYQLGGISWELRTLSAGERVEATRASAEINDGLTRLNTLRLSMLARALVKVNDINILSVDEAMSFLGSLQAPLIDLLSERYDKLQAKQEEALRHTDELKN